MYPDETAFLLRVLQQAVYPKMQNANVLFAMSYQPPL